MREEGGLGAEWAWSYLDRELPSVPDPRQDLDFHVKIKLPGPELRPWSYGVLEPAGPRIIRGSRSSPPPSWAQTRPS